MEMPAAADVRWESLHHSSNMVGAKDNSGTAGKSACELPGLRMVQAESTKEISSGIAGSNTFQMPGPRKRQPQNASGTINVREQWLGRLWRALHVVLGY